MLRIPLLQLEIPLMQQWPDLLSLHKHIQHGPNNRHKVQRQIQQRLYHRLRGDFPRTLNRPLDDRSKTCHRVFTLAASAAATFDLSAFRDKLFLSACHQRPIENIEQCVPDNVPSSEIVRDRTALRENHKRCGDGTQQWAAGDAQDRCVREVREEEHGCRHAHAQTGGWPGLGQRRSPEGFVGA